MKEISQEKATKYQFALIIGAMKAGTTALFSLLEQHPEICGCTTKEPQFFLWGNCSERPIIDYYKLWNYNPKKHKFALEASTAYTKKHYRGNSAQYIKNAGIDARFIYILRHPLERINSQLKMASAFNYKIFNNAREFTPQLNSQYYFQIIEYYKRFPKENILFLHFEDLKEHPLKTLKRVCSFLKIDTTYSFDLSRMIKNESSTYLAPFSAPLKWRIIYQLKLGIKMILGKRSKYKKQKFKVPDEVITLDAVLSKEEQDVMITALKNDMAMLEKDFGFDTSKWVV